MLEKMKICAATFAAVSAIAGFCAEGDPMTASDEIASRLTERFAEGGRIKVAALVVGGDDEGVALVDDGKGNHIKISRTCKTEHDSLFFARFLALKRLIHSNLNCV